MKNFIKSLTTAFVAFFLMAGSTSAVVDTVTISDLPEYTNSDNFELSFSALSNDPISAQFYFRKEGGSYSSFGSPVSGSSGQIQVDNGQVGEQIKYYFKVEINGGTAVDETSVIYDVSGPSPVSDYWREEIAPGQFRLHWKNPHDDDFSRVFIYRSESSDFDASGSTKRAEVGGAKEQEMTWDDFGLDPSKTYFYALRAVDHAGNGSGLVSDVSDTIEETITTSAQGEVSILPRSEGSVLGDEDTSMVNDGDEGTDSEKMLDTTMLDGEVAGAKGDTAKNIVYVVIFIVFGFYLLRLVFKKKE